MATKARFQLLCFMIFWCTVWSDASPVQSDDSSLQTQSLLMRGAKPLQHDAYLCTGYPVSEDEAYIYKFQALANASTAHHMLMYGCDGEPYSKADVWNCPSMCKGKQVIIFAWAKNAPPTQMPKDVGLKIGKSSNVKTIVLQVHYAKKFEKTDKADHSGIKIFTTKKKPKYVAGVFLLMAGWFTIPPHKPLYPVDISCVYNGQKSMFPFAYRTHSHGLGRVITGYQYNNSYHMIGKGNPQWPQAFYPVKEIFEVKPGDKLAARCTYNSTDKNHAVSVGATGDDEMCNFYIMYYTDSSVDSPGGECAGNRLPQLTGTHFPKDVSEQLPPNPALEEKASGHHHHGAMGGHHEEAEPTEAPTEAPKKESTDIHFDHKLELNTSWPGHPYTIGQVGGLSVDSQGNVYVFHRASRTWTGQSFDLNNNFRYQDAPIEEDTILIMKRDGELIRKFGAGEYFMPHGIQVDDKNNIWLTDVGLHQVFKIPAGKTKPSLTLGHRFKNGKELTSFCKPTDVAVLSNGEFFVSDGYCNSRVIKFSADGKVIRAWGERNLVFSPTPPPGTFAIPHGVTVSEKDNLVCVADRENGRIQCFDLEGNLEHVIKHPEFGSRLFALEYCPNHGGILYAVNGPTYGGPKISVQGFTLDIKTGDLLETWNTPQGLKNPHDIAVDPSGHSVYVGELDPRIIWKFSRAEIPPPEHYDDHGEDKVIVNQKKNMEIKSKSSSTDQKSTKGVENQTSSINGTALASDNTKTKINPDDDITPSIVIGIMLVVPVVLMLIVTLLVRAHQAGKLKCYGHSRQRVFNLQGFLGNSHKGFDRLSTEESDHEDLDDSDRDEYCAPIRGKAGRS